MKPFFKTVGKMIAIMLAAAAVGVLLLTAVFAMPDTRMRAHLEESATNRVFLNNLAYEYILDGQLLSFTDNHVDARFLMSACNWNTENQNAMQRAMEATFPIIDSVMFRTQTLNELFAKDANYDYLYPYARYWHGVQLFMRPLLFFFTYPEIVTLNGIVQALLLGVILALMTRRGLWREAIAFGVALMCVGAYIFSASLCLSICYYIFLVAMIVMLLRHEWLTQGNRYLFFFLGLGISTAYFDTLSWPAVTFGVPLILYALLTPACNFKKRLGTVASFAASWLFGYAGFWALKFPIAAAVTGENIMKSVTSNVSHHTFGYERFNDVEINLVNALKKLIYPYNTTVIRLLAAVCLVLFAVAAVMFLLRVRDRAPRRVYACRLLTFAFVCLIPFVWYSVLQSHSIVHNLNYPDRLMLMTLWGGMCMITRLFAAADDVTGKKCPLPVVDAECVGENGAQETECAAPPCADTAGRAQL